MSEISTQTIPEGLNKTTEAYPSSEILNLVEERGIKLADKESVALGLQVLRSEFGIRDEAFSDFKRLLALTAVAERFAKVENHRGVANSKYGAELQYVADLVMGIAGDYTMYAQGSHYIDTGDNSWEPSDQHKKDVYERYANHELGREMQEHLHGPAFEQLRQRLGVVDEEPFQVRVISAETGSGYGLVPLVATITDQPDWETFINNTKEEDIRGHYRTELANRGKKFVQELGYTDMFAPVWVSSFDDGTKYLCISSPLAEKILYPSEERAAHYDESDFAHDVAFLEHEYVHTQGSLLFSKGDVFGLSIALEELRAEHFSGNAGGYTDIKRYFMGMAMLTGYSPVKSFEINGDPYDQDAFLTDIAKNIGLAGLLDALTVIPTSYAQAENANVFIKEIVAHNGGSLSSHFQRLYDRIVEQDGLDTVEARISNFVDNLREAVRSNSFVTVESWFALGRCGSLRDIGIRNFRSRYPDESDGCDYADKPKDTAKKR